MTKNGLYGILIFFQPFIPFLFLVAIGQCSNIIMLIANFLFFIVLSFPYIILMAAGTLFKNKYMIHVFICSLIITCYSLVKYWLVYEQPLTPISEPAFIFISVFIDQLKAAAIVLIAIIVFHFISKLIKKY